MDDVIKSNAKNTDFELQVKNQKNFNRTICFDLQNFKLNSTKAKKLYLDMRAC